VDEQARACANGGGVVGVNGINAFLGAGDPNTATVADHIEYLLDLLGADHVGVGLDYFFEPDEESGFNEVMANQAEYWPPDQYPGGEVRAAQPCQFYELAESLLRRNHSDATVKGVLGGNFKRVADQVWGG
jgi:membrane dipeptidase